MRKKKKKDKKKTSTLLLSVNINQPGWLQSFPRYHQDHLPTLPQFLATASALNNCFGTAFNVTSVQKDYACYTFLSSRKLYKYNSICFHILGRDLQAFTFQQSCRLYRELQRSLWVQDHVEHLWIYKFHSVADII